MASCLAAAAYIYDVDVLEQIQGIDPETNEIIRNWQYKKTIKAYVYPYLDGGIRGSGTTERFADVYANSDYLRLKCSKELSKRDRVTNIRLRKSKRVIYQEGIDGPPTVYNVDGAAPIVNTLTNGIDEWLTTLSRAEIQA